MSALEFDHSVVDWLAVCRRMHRAGQTLLQNWPEIPDDPPRNRSASEVSAHYLRQKERRRLEALREKCAFTLPLLATLGREKPQISLDNRSAIEKASRLLSRLDVVTCAEEMPDELPTLGEELVVAVGGWRAALKMALDGWHDEEECERKRLQEQHLADLAAARAAALAEQARRRSLGMTDTPKRGRFILGREFRKRYGL